MAAKQQRARLGGCCNNYEWAHHFVVFMIKNVAVPNVSRTTRWIKLVVGAVLRRKPYSNHCNRASVYLNGVFPALFIWSGLNRLTYKVRI